MFEYAKLRALRDLVSQVSRALHPLVPHVLHALCALMSHVPFSLRAQTGVLCALRAVGFHMPHATHALFSTCSGALCALCPSCLASFMHQYYFLHSCFPVLHLTFLIYFHLVSFLGKFTTVKIKILWADGQH